MDHSLRADCRSKAADHSRQTAFGFHIIKTMMMMKVARRKCMMMMMMTLLIALLASGCSASEEEEEIFQWIIREGGVVHPALKMGINKDGVRGIFVSEPGLEQDALLVRVP